MKCRGRGVPGTDQRVWGTEDQGRVEETGQGQGRGQGPAWGRESEEAEAQADFQPRTNGIRFRV